LDKNVNTVTLYTFAYSILPGFVCFFIYQL